METDATAACQKYVVYVKRLHEALDAAEGMRVPEAYRAPLLSFEEFARVWERWGNQQGLQEFWLDRFSEGSRRVAAA